jgi:hypothetical protein
MVVFGTDKGERFWILASASCGVLLFLSAALIHKKRYATLVLSGAGVMAATAGGALLLEPSWGPGAWRIAVVEYRGGMDGDDLEATAERLLKDVDVQIWVKNSVLLAPDAFPQGVLVHARRENGGYVLDVAIPHKLTSLESTAHELGAALGMVFEARIGGAKRIFTVGAGRELQLQQALPRLRQGREAPSLDAAVRPPSDAAATPPSDAAAKKEGE